MKRHALTLCLLLHVYAQDWTLEIDLTNSSIASLPIATNFVSLSAEIDDTPHYLGPADNISAAFVSLMLLLRNSGPSSRGPTLRVAGDSSDYSLWWPQNGSLPHGQTYAITNADLDMYAAALPKWGGKMVLGTSLYLANSTQWGSAHAKAVSAHAAGWTFIEGVEIGNEPEGFNGGEAFRPRSWSPVDFAREFEAHSVALVAAGMPADPPLLQGFVLGGNDTAFNRFWPNFTQEFAPILASVSRHHYALEGCAGGSPFSVWDLLASDAAAFLLPYASAAATAGVPFVVGETNSVSCGGQRGVSDVFAAALWALDFALSTAAFNASEVNWHGGPHSAYAPIQTEPPSLAPRAMPLFYGLWAASFATSNASSITTHVRSGTAPAQVRVHTLRDGAGMTRVVVVHKTNSTDAVVRVVGGRKSTNATLRRLSASAVTDARGVSFGGLTLDGVTDGVPVPGGPPMETIPCVAGVFSFKVFSGTAAILVF